MIATSFKQQFPAEAGRYGLTEPTETILKKKRIAIILKNFTSFAEEYFLKLIYRK